MKRYLIPIMAILLLASGLTIGCGQSLHQETTRDKHSPILKADNVKQSLENYFMKPYRSDPNCWAYPIFPTEKWSAYYKTDEDVWLVRVYNTDSSYAGTWAVPDVSGEIKPYDEVAKALALKASKQSGMIAIMPSLPSFAKYPNAVDPHNPAKCMIQAVQVYIANMSFEKYGNPSLPTIQKLVRSYYPLDWHITYMDDWRISTVYYEYAVMAHIVPDTGRIVVFDMYGIR